MISPTEISGLKIITILDNITQSAGPVAHWGVSTLIDYEVSGRNKRVLLDTGSDRECVLRNLKELKIDLRGMRAQDTNLLALCCEHCREVDCDKAFAYASLAAHYCDLVLHAIHSRLELVEFLDAPNEVLALLRLIRIG
jgi:hypothetical protein